MNSSDSATTSTDEDGESKASAFRGSSAGASNASRRPNENRIIINVGGVKFETYKSTLRNLPDTRLAWLTQTTTGNVDYDHATGEYFFDRHAGVFQHVLNFYRTGKLHAPLEVCGPMYEEELTFWGIDEKQIEPCCWNIYRTHRDAEEQMAEFAYMLQGASDDEHDDEADNVAARFGFHDDAAAGRTRWQKLRPKVWKILDNPASSRAARWCNFLSFFVIAISIVTFCLLTLPSIQPPDLNVDPFVCLFHSKTDDDDAKQTVATNSDRQVVHVNATPSSSTTTTARIGINDSVLYAANSNSNTTMAQLAAANSSSLPPTEYFQSFGRAGIEQQHPLCSSSIVWATLNVIDACCVVVFTLEFTARFVFTPDRREFFRSFYTYYDILAFVPFYLQRVILISLAPTTNNIGANILLKLLNFTRIFRVFRVFRVARNVTGIKILMQTLKTSSNELLLLVSVLVLAMLMFSSCIYYAQVIELAFSDKSIVEHQRHMGEQGDVVITSVPAGLWWAAITLTTIGYGDKRPTTNIGFFIGFFCAVSSALSLSLPVPIIVNNFAKYYQFVQAQMRLPKKKRRALVQAHDALKQQPLKDNAEYDSGSIASASSGSASSSSDNSSSGSITTKPVWPATATNGTLSYMTAGAYTTHLGGGGAGPKKVSFISPVTNRKLSSGSSSITSSQKHDVVDSGPIYYSPDNNNKIESVENNVHLRLRRDIAKRLVMLATSNALSVLVQKTAIWQQPSGTIRDDNNNDVQASDVIKPPPPVKPQQQQSSRPASRHSGMKTGIRNVDMRKQRRASIAPVAM